jgi:hypothetical protein
MTDIPALVLARLELHAAETRVALETLKAKMQGEHVWPSRSKAMRAQRDRLTAELAAWEYLTAHANGLSIRHALEEEFSRKESTTAAGIDRIGCDQCGHDHRQGDMCTIMLSGGHCGCTS